MGFTPVNGDLGHELVARTTLSSSAAKGWWAPTSIVLTDKHGNQRVQRLRDGTFGWRLYVNNPNEDLVEPEYVLNSIDINLLYPGEVDANPELLSDEREIVVSWRVFEEISDWVYCGTAVTNFADDRPIQYSMGSGADANKLVGWQSDGATHTCRISLIATRYLRSGQYGPVVGTMLDEALNNGRVDFAIGHATFEPPPIIDFEAITPDEVAPVATINRCFTRDYDEACLRVEAWPTNPIQPNGETVVRIHYYAYEDQPIENASGLHRTVMTLRDPQGKEFSFSHDNLFGVEGYSPKSHLRYFECPDAALAINPDCDATTPVKYIFEYILPQGSAPGTWGLVNMSLEDKAWNQRSFIFTEELRFDVD
jgi:hypothetical protein